MLDRLASDAGAELFERPCPRTGIKIRGLVWTPAPGVAIRATVLILHGIQSNSLWFSRLATSLQNQGILVVAVDRRGSGLSDGYQMRGAPRSPITEITGARGHVVGMVDLMTDIDLGLQELEDRCGEDSIPCHLVANCFSTRLALAFVARQPEKISQLCFLSSADALQKRADLRPSEKLRALLTRCRWTRSRLRDDWFSEDPAIRAWMADPTRSLTLRSFSSGLVRATAVCDREARSSLRSCKLPLLLVLAERDRIVESDRVENRFKRCWAGPLEVRTFDSEHFVDFCPREGNRFRRAIRNRIIPVR